MEERSMENRGNRTDVPVNPGTQKETRSKSGGQSVREVMTPNPQTVTPADNLQKVAKYMVDCDCGALPVVEGDKVVGMITDRDIVIRVVANGRNPLEARVSDAMSTGVKTVKESDSLAGAMKVMAENKVRRVPVVNEQGKVVGIIAQADLATEAADENRVERTVEKISQKGGSSR